jgi:hypothetical protein
MLGSERLSGIVEKGPVEDGNDILFLVEKNPLLTPVVSVLVLMAVAYYLVVLSRPRLILNIVVI